MPKNQSYTFNEKAQRADEHSIARRLSRHRTEAAPYASATAFRQLYEHTHLSVFRFIYSLHGGPQQVVEDLTAETFERAWKARGRFRGDEHAATGWLITIARNRVLDELRKRQRREEDVALGAEIVGIPSETTIDQQIIQDEYQRVLLTALQTLSVQEREMVILRYILGWKVKQIAAHYCV